MGEVWKARDTRLRRDVAIKSLTATLAQEPERLARLEREAELLATLNHHHIAAIHGLEQFHGTSYLVLELVEGDTLEDRIRRGPIKIEQALTLALQLTAALEAAHGKGIVHRDLKPANIKITTDNRIKVLDFGIAKALAAVDDDQTRAVDATGIGTVMGTPAYMSPEQARGELIGFQSDVWSFGVVLYEMLTGVSPFKRKSTADTLASVLESQPDYALLPATTPNLARRLMQRCLEKAPARRLQHMGEVRVLVEESLASLGTVPSAVSTRTARGRRPWIAAGVVAATLAGVAIWFWGNRSAGTDRDSPIYVSMPFVGRAIALPFGTRQLAISPDASTIAFMSSSGLQVRRVHQQERTVISTRGSNPFFSPDGEWIGLFLDTHLIKIPAGGGTPVQLTPTTDRPGGGSWRADGTIVFATSEGLYEVSANGGVAKVIATPARDRNELLYAWPQFLPDGRSILFTIVSADPAIPPQTVLLDLKTLERKPVLQGSSAFYVSSGHLVYVADAKLTAVTFDAATGAVTGKPVLFPDIGVAAAADNGAADFAIADAGTLIFIPPASATLRTLEWIDRRGRREALAVEPQEYGYAMVSPDGTRVAVERTTAGNRDVWILDLKRLTQTQLTDGPTEDMLPTWSADGQRVFFASTRSGNFDVFSQAADGASSAKLEFAGPELQAPSAVTPDGTRLIVYDRFKDLAVLDLAKPDRLEPLLQSDFDERLGQVSPDGHWIAYESNESGKQFEIVLRSFPNVHARRETISVNGGRFPRWGPSGSNELYYVTPDGAMMAASVKFSPALALGPPKKLFDWQKPPQGRSGHLYDVAPDGRFLMTKAATPNLNSPTNMTVILNWLEVLRHPRQ